MQNGHPATADAKPLLRSGTHEKPTIEVKLPEVNESIVQDSEWVVVEMGDQDRRIRIHDYDELFSIPGLYEKVVSDLLQCDSPKVVADMLEGVMKKTEASPTTLRVLDLGAGNGMVGEEVRRFGAELVVGLDIIEEAAEAAERDRPGVYDNYHVMDLTRLNDAQERELLGYGFNCLTCVAALGFGDIPPEAFTSAFNVIRPGGWIAINIKEDFLNNEDSSGFAELIHSMTHANQWTIRSRRRYEHRLGIDQEPIHYVGLVGHKLRDLL